MITDRHVQRHTSNERNTTRRGEAGLGTDAIWYNTRVKNCSVAGEKTREVDLLAQPGDTKHAMASHDRHDPVCP